MHNPPPAPPAPNNSADDAPLFGLDDSVYCPRQTSSGGGLITRVEARAVALAKLALRSDSIVWDIGAGSGSVGLEAARIAQRGHVYAIEKNPADAAIARDNSRRLGVANYSLVEGRAPQAIAAWPAPDAVFIGGSGGELAALIALALERLAPGGRLVINLVTLDNLTCATTALDAADAAGIASWELVQLQASRSRRILATRRLAAENPVWIFTATRSAAAAEARAEPGAR
jgi:precorrin-6Y C5,15-methyltransferase (decarboxylating)